MAYDANYWNSGQFMGNMPQEGPQVNQPQINDTNYGLLNAAQGPGFPEGGAYGEWAGPYSNEWYDKQGVSPLLDDLDEYPGPSEFVEGMVPHGLWKDYDEDTGEYGEWAGPYGDKEEDGKLSFNLGNFGKGLMDLANQQSYDYDLF